MLYCWIIVICLGLLIKYSYIYVFSVLTFGFEPLVYSVSESIGSVDLGVFFISGNAGEFVPHVNASTNDGTATGKYFIPLLNRMIEKLIISNFQRRSSRVYAVNGNRMCTQMEC